MVIDLKEVLQKHLEWLRGITTGIRANLCDADLRGADLRGANLHGANLRGADLCGANLRDADLRGADLCGADLCGANLLDADLLDANLRGAVGVELAIAKTRVAPREGSVIGWKKCNDGVIVKLKVPEAAKRSNAFGRKCRAEFVEVLELFGGEVGISQHDGKTEYRVGETVHCDQWCDDFMIECTGGIHFFVTREEAEAY